jgi:PleD family two-component response regulator
VVATLIGLCLGVGQAPGASLDEPAQALLVEAVEAAYALDLYHARCRSDGSNRRTENLNKLLASRLRVTVLRVQDDMFPERNYRKVQERLQADFLTMLRERGGCDAVKESDLPAALRARYDEAIRAIESLP